MTLRPRLESGRRRELDALGGDRLRVLAGRGVDLVTASLTIARGSAISAAAAAVSSVDQTVTTTAGPGRSTPPACSIAARAWCEPS